MKFLALTFSLFILFGTSLIGLGKGPLVLQDDLLVKKKQTVLKAMVDEMDRSFKRLSMPNYEKPYFIEYVLVAVNPIDILAKYGSVVSYNNYTTSSIDARVRVGSYKFDNTSLNYWDYTYYSGYRASTMGSFDGDYPSLRQSFWLLTDQRYKEALSSYLKKKGELVYKTIKKESDSFSQEKPSVYTDPEKKRQFDIVKWMEILKTVSQEFKNYPEIFDSSVNLNTSKGIGFYINSEGTRLITEDIFYRISLYAVTRASDGMILRNDKVLYFRFDTDLPTQSKLIQMTKKLVDELLKLRKAPVLDPFNGPAILEPESAGVFFHETMGHRFEGEKVENDHSGQTFKEQLNKKIMPEFLNIIDDPTLETFQGKKLNGYYLFDDEGVKAQRIVLVENGVLRNFLMSRKPIKGFPKSNGHGRAQNVYKSVARMSNLIISATKTYSHKQLKEMLIAECKRQGKAFGLIIKNIQGGYTNTSSYGFQAFKGIPILVYKVDAKTGEETLVRGVEFVGTPLSTINKIIAVGNKSRIFNGVCGAESGYVPVSTISPAILMSEIELQRRKDIDQRDIILPPPWQEK